VKNRLKIVVDWELCESNAVCVGHAPEVFEVDAEDKLRLLREVVPTDALDRVETAVRCCPKGALSLVEE
jgi:ferredoxin